MSEEWFSVRMRASKQGGHLSGGERIGPGRDVEKLTSGLICRALNHVGGVPDDVHCTVEKLSVHAIEQLVFPEVRTWRVRDWRAGRQLSIRLLTEAGICEEVANDCVAALARGPAPGRRAMRGAMIVDAETGRRLEPDQERGVRVSRMDVTPAERSRVEQHLHAAGLGHYRVLEALVLAGKVLHAPGLLAELCWSDDPDYLAGYVATLPKGYQRISSLKKPGSFSGGRVFLVDLRQWSSSRFIDYLEKQPVLIGGLPRIHPAADWKL